MELEVVELISPEPIRQPLKKRYKTLAKTYVVHSRTSGCGIRMSDGSDVGSLPPSSGTVSSGGLHERSKRVGSTSLYIGTARPYSERYDG